VEEEPRRLLGFPVGGRGATPGPLGSVPLGPVDRTWLRCMLHPWRALRAWNRYRRLGPYDVEGRR
jgi:hypothetical protein